jgi:trans-2,3-dihydro-3-hydroxyanthranilate isomerase
MRRRFFTLDVFTDRRYAGNPLAVVLEPQGIATEAMQAIAREFNHPETVFVFPPRSGEHRARLRIFTPAAELPFAGHPTVGTAVLLARLDGGKACELVLEEGIGNLHCRCEPRGGDGGYAQFALARMPEKTSMLADQAAIAAALSLRPEHVGFDSLTPETWSAGNAFTFVPVRGLEPVRRARPDLATWDGAFGQVVGAFVFCRETLDAGNAFHARMFAPSAGIFEDPATGSAVAALAGMIAEHSRLADGAHEFRIEQGYEMGRSSLITLALTLTQGKLAAATIGGEAIVVSEGMLET